MGARHDGDGLSEAEAARRLAAHGPNSLAAPERRSWRRIGADAAREPMFLLLAGAALLYLALGQPGEGLFLCGMVVVNLGLSLYQEGKTERALAALRALASPRAQVLRGGRWQSIDGADVVRGDIIALNKGDRVPADARLLSSNGMQADESLLTGESMPVTKDGAAMLFAGALVLQGDGVAQVAATGARSQLGRIAASLQGVRAAPSPLQRQGTALARAFAVVGLALSASLVLVYGYLRGDWPQALLAGIALAMSMLPEELPVIMTVFPAIGAWRLARQHVLTRRLAAIETLGAISVLCVDKAGTLTANRMEVVALEAHGVRHPVTPGALPAGFATLVETARLASAARGPDPIDQAVQRLGQASLAAPQRHPDWVLLHEYGVSAQQRALVQVWRRGDARLVAAAKGAPETILNWCELDPSTRASALAAAAEMAQGGLRVLAVAHAVLPEEIWPTQAADLALRYDGLLALADPLRPEIPACVLQCRQAGIRVVMITGDHPDTAHAIALQAGLDDTPALTGTELDALDAAGLAERLATLSVCARIAPGQKLRLVQALARSGATVAMTGDGVNDAPALKAAHVGIAMGGRGTDVAREAAALVLLDDRFASIIEAIRAGRRIHDNMRKSMRYIISMHAPIAGMAILPILAGWPPLLYPMHIVFLQMIIDTACALVFENDPAAPQLMRRPPLNPQAPLFDAAALIRALALGVLPCAAVAGAYAWALGALAPAPARAFGFTALVLANLSLILANRAGGSGLWASLRQPNRLLWGVSGAALAMLALVLYQPWLAAVFQFGALTPALAAGAGALGLASGLVPALLSRRDLRAEHPR
ncbi:cation-translocating P-type ATPase [Massilia sp. S19_KUP03_FR1]|uniref:cation-translocating P-type ATPase n=1 Tax=Massilia sp. S19_KUP03_FR1 TaxID=3025503 RepID=UPI002FCDD12E